MYSGLEFRNHSGAIIGAHQKIDRVAYRHLRRLGVTTKDFPAIKQILHFEGRNGPDGLKLKSPMEHEPSHFIDPFDDDDTGLIEDMVLHRDKLVEALKNSDEVAAAFQAAWLAHTVVDGLTPAHQYPYEEALADLRGGVSRENANVLKKFFVPGATKRQIILNNWKKLGVGGLMSTHILFELGTAFIIAPLRLKTSFPTNTELAQIKEVGIENYFLRNARHIAMLDIYDRFYDSGWTNKLVRDVRNELAPTMIRCLATIWYDCIERSKK